MTTVSEIYYGKLASVTIVTTSPGYRTALRYLRARASRWTERPAVCPTLEYILSGLVGALVNKSSLGSPLNLYGLLVGWSRL